MAEISKTSNKRLWLLSIAAFLGICLEILSVISIEQFIYGTLSFNAFHKTIHSLWISILWSIYIFFILRYATHKCELTAFHTFSKINMRDWCIAIICLLVCKWFTYMDWHTLKIIGEAHLKAPLQLFTQYLYYCGEVFLVMLTLLFAQEAWDRTYPSKAFIPMGGIVLALTWGAFHFVSRCQGIELWNGISTMIFSLLAGIIFTRLKNNIWFVYLFLWIGYLL